MEIFFCLAADEVFNITYTADITNIVITHVDAMTRASRDSACMGRNVKIDVPHKQWVINYRFFTPRTDLVVVLFLRR